MNRKPIYHPRNDKLRIISCPGGLWVAQKLTGKTGSKTVDPWEALHVPTTKEEALQQCQAKA